MKPTSTLPDALPKSEKRHAGRTAAEQTPLEIRTHHTSIAPSFEEEVRERASRKLGKHGHHVERITIRFEDRNGPKGGVDVICRVHILMPNAPDIIVDHVAASAQEAFAMALQASDTALRRAVERRGFSAPHERRSHAEASASDGSAASNGNHSTGGDDATDDVSNRNPTDRMAAAFETSEGRPSRKSTRASANHTKQDGDLRLKAVNGAHAPSTKARQARAANLHSAGHPGR
jgi:hypothetical protein